MKTLLVGRRSVMAGVAAVIAGPATVRAHSSQSMKSLSADADAAARTATRISPSRLHEAGLWQVRSCDLYAKARQAADVGAHGQAATLQHLAQRAAANARDCLGIELSSEAI